ncbi:MAG: flagellar basal-body MS-ring/collar protein FliF [Armatimonadota bacterium]|jgi:flagellar M-ring protein FliF
MLEQLRETWEALERRQQISLIALAALLLGGLVAVGVWAAQPSWAVLYSELSPQDAQTVVERLREAGVRHQLADRGTTVQVPRERLYELRIELAGEGLPGGSNVGFELFDRSSFSTSDLQNNVNLQRALQGELERSICTLEEIKSARVHVALPEERLFREQQEPPSASVVVGLAGAKLGAGQVAAITQLVSSAVPGLEADAVTVVDTVGRVLTGGIDGGGGMQTMAQLEATRAWEERVRGHLQTMLDSVLGANRSVVRVQATLDFQSQQITRESFDPPEGLGVVRREELTEEQYEGDAGREVGGPAGLDGRPEAGRGGGGSYQHRHESREYDYARLQEQVSSPPGALQRLAVAVVVDESLGAGTGRQVRQLVEAAAGIEPERGDVVTVETMAIEAVKIAQKEAELAESAAAERARAQSMSRALRYASVIVMLAMIAGAMLMVSRRLGPQEEPDTGDGRREEPSGETVSDADASDDEESVEFGPVSFAELEASTEGDEPSYAAGQPQAPEPQAGPAERLSELGNRSPEDFARHLSGWLHQMAEGDGDAGDEQG